MTYILVKWNKQALQTGSDPKRSVDALFPPPRLRRARPYRHACCRPPGVRPCTFVEQITANAKVAIDKAVELSGGRQNFHHEIGRKISQNITCIA